MGIKFIDDWDKFCFLRLKSWSGQRFRILCPNGGVAVQHLLKMKGCKLKWYKRWCQVVHEWWLDCDVECVNCNDSMSEKSCDAIWWYKE